MSATVVEPSHVLPAKIRHRSPIRGEIQALRALAVGLVLLNHLWPDRVPGGYIGVDIFFVISGYLITAHLMREADNTGRINLPSFWARRAKRLLPAALAVLAFSIVMAAAWLPITTRQSAFDQIGAAGVYVLNWLLAASSLDYFAQGSALSPVTHFWSLSVEEQFYLVWPLLLAGCLWLTRTRWSAARCYVIVGTFACVFVASFLWGIRESAVEPDAAYFQTAGRAWEFAAGGLLAFVPAATAQIKRWLIPIAWTAWMALGFSSFVFDAESGFPGAFALVPVIATAIIIWVGDINHSWAPTALTSFGPIQWLGDASYSAYLWHWPLIVAATSILNRDLHGADKVVILGVALSVAYLSKRFIEDPVRSMTTARWGKPRWVLWATATAMLMVVVVTVTMSTQMGERARTAAASVAQQAKVSGKCFAGQAVVSGETCDKSHLLSDENLVLVNESNQNSLVPPGGTCQELRGSTQVRGCSFGVEKGRETTGAALIGDSHARVWAPALSAIAEQEGLRITSYLQSACPATLDPAIEYRDNTYRDGCKQWREAAIAKVAADPSIDVVVTSSNDRSYFIGGASEGSLRATDPGDGYVAAWETWLSAGKRVVVINDVPQHPVRVPDCLARSPQRVDPCTMNHQLVQGAGPLRLAANRIDDPKFTFVDFENVFCDHDVCHSVVGGVPAYIDSDHVTTAFARSLASEFVGVLTGTTVSAASIAQPSPAGR